MVQKLLPREKVFCAVYVANGGNARKAAQIAGYGQNANTTAIKTRPRVIEEIERIQEETTLRVLSAHNLTTDDIADNLINEAFSAGKAASRIRAWELLGRWKGMFVDVVENRVISNLSERDTIVEAAKHLSEFTVLGMAFDLHVADKQTVDALRQAGHENHADFMADRVGDSQHVVIEGATELMKSVN